VNGGIVQVLAPRSDTSGMANIGIEGPTREYEGRMHARDGDGDDGLRSEVGQSLVLFGMSLVVVLVGLLVGLGL
jgi:hypothetical protein